MAVKRLLDGRFQLLRVISSKSYSKTYLMTDHSDPNKAKCIVKHLQLPTRNPVTLKFLNDLLAKRAKSLQRLGEHPALAKTLSCIQDGVDFYWVRAYVPGRSLQAELAIPQPRSEPEVRRFLKEVLSCLEVLQHYGIVHQNLHPSNIIRHQTDDHLVLVDYSLAQEGNHPKLEGNGDQPHLRLHPAYLPQVLHRQYPTFNADHFALAMMALQYATGLGAEALPQLPQPDFREQFELQLDECSSLSPATKSIVLGMVSPQPAQEFLTAKAILAQLAPSPNLVDPDAAISPQDAGFSPSLRAGEEPAPGPAWARSTPFRGQSKQWWMGAIAIPLVLLAGLALVRLPQHLALSRLARQAEKAQNQGQMSEAVTILDQILERQPDHAQALAQRSAILWDSGNSDQALQDITTAIQSESNNPDWYFKRGNIRLHVGDQQGAIADYTEALSLDQLFSDAYVNRGSARAQRGDEAGAVGDYTAALEVASDPKVKAFALLNRCLSYSNLEDHAAALTDCTEAINLQPNNSLAYENRGLVKRRLGDSQGALQDFTIAIQIDPSSPEPYYNRALTRQELGDLEGAMDDFNQTLTLAPDHPFAYYDRGLLYIELGKTTQAIADLERVATVCLEVGRVGCFEDAKYQLNELGVATP
jgi:tetratricopeptide (TPR) repeat protein